MTQPLITRDEAGFSVLPEGRNTEPLFTGLAFSDATEVARALATGAEVWPCTWGVEVWTEDGPAVRDCGAPVTTDDRGWTCLAGHGHVSMQARHNEGWDYFEDDEIQAARQGHYFPGVAMRDMQGREIR